ncbi:MAG: hypothetical protein IJT35_02135 [Paludibacteraceae bacterium]|nr:hypothetical protein [Paludibacteraceae bacterium]
MKNNLNILLTAIILLLGINTIDAQYTVQPVPFHPVQVEPVQFHPIQSDNTILQRSFEQMEKRRTEANEQYAKLQILLAEYGIQLHNDEATLKWFSEYKKNISGTFYDFVTLDPGGARDYAVRKQGEIAGDPELMARIRTANEYNAKLKAIENRTDLDWQQKQEWVENNPYCFVVIKDDEGKVIGGRLGTKAELEQQKREIERLRKEQELEAKKKEEMEQKRLYLMAHPFDSVDYSHYETIIDYPTCKKCPEGLVVTKVALSNYKTRIEIECTSSNSNQWINISHGAYIKAGLNWLKIVSIKNIVWHPDIVYFKKSGEKLLFALTFPPLSPKVKSFSIVELDRDGLKIEGIKIK